MLVHEGDHRNVSIDLRLAILLASIAGALNTAGYQAVGLFSANMTGNISALSDNLGLGQFGAAGLFGVLILAFIVGAFVSGLLIEAGRERKVRAIYAFSIAFEAVLLLLLGGLVIFVRGFDQSAFLALGLSFIMGLQNAATTRISNARVRTTHVSGMATDVGLGLAALWSSGPERANAIPRLRLYASTMIAFLVGGILGVLLYLALGGYLFIITSAVLFAIAVPEARRARISD